MGGGEESRCCPERPSEAGKKEGNSTTADDGGRGEGGGGLKGAMGSGMRGGATKVGGDKGREWGMCGAQRPSHRATGREGNGAASQAEPAGVGKGREGRRRKKGEKKTSRASRGASGGSGERKGKSGAKSRRGTWQGARRRGLAVQNVAFASPREVEGGRRRSDRGSRKIRDATAPRFEGSRAQTQTQSARRQPR